MSTQFPARTISYTPIILVAALVAMACARFAVASSAGLADDEAYYWLWSIGTPSLSYLDHPPMVAWFINAGRAIGGDSTLGVRLIGVLAPLLGAVALWRTAAILFDTDVAKRTVWLMLAMPLLAVGGVVMTPDTPSVLFAGLTLWALAELHRSQNAWWWLGVGVCAGLGLQSKYTNLFMGVTILLWLIAVPANRRWFLSWQLWAGGAIAAMIAAPVVYWNAQHEWVSFAKQFGRVARKVDIGVFYLAEMAGAFFALASPVIAGLAIAGLWHVTRTALRDRHPSHVLVAASVLPMLLYFLLHALHDRVQANWLAPLYPALAICAAIALGTIAGDARRSRVLVGAVALGLMMSTFIYVHAVQPLASQLVRKDPTDQLRGWDGLADQINQLRIAKGAGWVATANYSTTGQLAYALRGRTPVAQINERIRYENLPCLPMDVALEPAIAVELVRRRPAALLSQAFENVVALAPLKRVYDGQELASYAVFLVSGPKNTSATLAACLKAAPESGFALKAAALILPPNLE